MKQFSLYTFSIALMFAHTAWGQSASAPVDYYQVITDSTFSSEKQYRQEFGYAVFLQFEGTRVLFDTGVTPEALEHNLGIAGIDPASIDVLILSHNHGDHIGGISYIRRASPNTRIYAPPEQDIDGRPLTRLTDVAEITPNLYAIRTHTDSPTVGIGDELSLVLRTKDGPYLLTACSHTGVSNIAVKAAKVAGEGVFHYTGGARLKFRGAEDTRQIAGELNQLQITQVSPGHCSVDHAVTRTMSKHFHGQVLDSVQGRKVALTPLSVSQ